MSTRLRASGLSAVILLTSECGLVSVSRDAKAENGKALVHGGAPQGDVGLTGANAAAGHAAEAPGAVLRWCERSGTASVCGLSEITHCESVEHRCRGMQGDKGV